MLSTGGYSSSSSCIMLKTVLGLALSVAGQDYSEYYKNSLTFELDLQEHENPNSNSNNLNM